MLIDGVLQHRLRCAGIHRSDAGADCRIKKTIMSDLILLIAIVCPVHSIYLSSSSITLSTNMVLGLHALVDLRMLCGGVAYTNPFL